MAESFVTFWGSLVAPKGTLLHGVGGRHLPAHICSRPVCFATERHRPVHLNWEASSSNLGRGTGCWRWSSWWLYLAFLLICRRGTVNWDHRRLLFRISVIVCNLLLCSDNHLRDKRTSKKLTDHPLSFAPVFNSMYVCVCVCVCARARCYERFKTKLNSVALVRERTIPTERPPPVGEVSANFCG